MLTTAQAGEIMEVDASRVRQLAGEGLIPGAEKHGRDWMIPRPFAEAYERQSRGWPKGRRRKQREDEQANEEIRRRVRARREFAYT